MGGGTANPTSFPPPGVYGQSQNSSTVTPSGAPAGGIAAAAPLSSVKPVVGNPQPVMKAPTQPVIPSGFNPLRFSGKMGFGMPFGGNLP
jgi:hypothetical protein